MTVAVVDTEGRPFEWRDATCERCEKLLYRYRLPLSGLWSRWYHRGSGAVACTVCAQ